MNSNIPFLPSDSFDSVSLDELLQQVYNRELIPVTVYSDGFSTLKRERKRIVREYGQETMDALDYIGYKHDARIDSGWNKEAARALVFIDMWVDGRIPVKLMERQYLGLRVYDSMPRWIQWILKRFTDKRKLKHVEVYI